MWIKLFWLNSKEDKLFNVGIATGLWAEKLNSNQLYIAKNLTFCRILPVGEKLGENRYVKNLLNYGYILHWKLDLWFGEIRCIVIFGALAKLYRIIDKDRRLKNR